jgi:hypothetical protein
MLVQHQLSLRFIPYFKLSKKVPVVYIENYAAHPNSNRQNKIKSHLPPFIINTIIVKYRTTTYVCFYNWKIGTYFSIYVSSTFKHLKTFHCHER